jgi:hypothetical protein
MREEIESRSYRNSEVVYEINHTVGVVRAFHKGAGYIPEAALSKIESRMIRRLSRQAFTILCESCGQEASQSFCYECQCRGHALGEFNMDEF